MLKRRRWTEEEDATLVSIMNESTNYEQDSIRASKKLVERTPKACYARYHKIKNIVKVVYREKPAEAIVQGISHEPLVSHEDSRVISIAVKGGTVNIAGVEVSGDIHLTVPVN